MKIMTLRQLDKAFAEAFGTNERELFNVNSDGFAFGVGYDEDISGNLEEFPECCGIGVMNQLDSWKRQDNEVLDLALQATILAAREGNYSYVLIADINKPTRDACIRNGWLLQTEFRNPNSGNTVFLFGHSTKAEPKTRRKAAGK